MLSFIESSKRLFFIQYIFFLFLVMCLHTANAGSLPDETVNKADFTGCGPSSAFPCTFKFTDKSSGEPVEWYWDFGDDGYSYKQNPKPHPYYGCLNKEPGCCFDVSLEVTFQDGTKDTALKEDCVCCGEFPPVLTVEPNPLEIDSSAGTASFIVSNYGGSGDMDWKAEVIEGGDWLTITSGASGTNSGLIGVSYRKNFTKSSREGEINVSSAQAKNGFVEITINQAGRVDDLRTDTILTLNLSSKSIEPGDNLTATGTLDTTSYTTSPEDSMHGMKISLEIKSPTGTLQTPVPETTTDQYGNYFFPDIQLFNRSGGWIIKASFEGTDTYEPTTSPTEKLTVLSTRETGYAILIQGRRESKEGIDFHKKTVETIYSTLKKRNITPENIRVFGYNLSEEITYENPSKTSIKNCIQDWAYNKISSQTAPLYIIMVGHGSHKKFYIYPEVIIPEDINSWVSELESMLPTYDFKDNPVFVMAGACDSGSFITDLSKTGRVIITSTAEGESALRGPSADDNIREGSYFLSEFFKAAGRGKSIKESFEDAALIIEDFSSDKSQLRSMSGLYHDKALQHPLIDDNGDGQGSNVVSAVPGKDGELVMDKYLGAGSDPEQLVIENVAPHISLDLTDALPELWIELNDKSLLDALWLEIKPPGFNYPDVESDEQIVPDFIRVDYNPQNCQGNRCLFDEYEEFDFSQPGAYEVFYFAKDKIEEKVLPPQKTMVYRNTEKNNPPESFHLRTPSDRSTLTGSPVLFSWKPARDPDEDNVTYSIFISDDENFSNPVIKDRIETSSIPIDISDELKDGKIYYWKVEAVDTFGGTTTSDETWRFFKDFSNIVLGTLDGTVTDKGTGEELSKVLITSNCGAYDMTGILSDQGTFYLACPEGSFFGTAIKWGYLPCCFTFPIVAGETTYIDFEMINIKSFREQGVNRNCSENTTCVSTGFSSLYPR